MISIIPNPDAWPEHKTMLEPLRVRADLPNILDEDENLWGAFDWRTDGFGARLELVGCATTRMMVDGDAEIILVAGDGPDWLRPMLEEITKWAKEEGAEYIYCAGRKGWARKFGWEPEKEENGMYYYKVKV